MECLLLSGQLEEIQPPALAERCEDLLNQLETEFLHVRQALNAVLAEEAVDLA